MVIFSDATVTTNKYPLENVFFFFRNFLLTVHTNEKESSRKMSIGSVFHRKRANSSAKNKCREK